MHQEIDITLRVRPATHKRAEHSQPLHAKRFDFVGMQAQRVEHLLFRSHGIAHDCFPARSGLSDRTTAPAFHISLSAISFSSFSSCWR